MVSRGLRFSLYAIAGLFAYGLFLILLWGGLDILTKWRLPELSRFSWWQILIAPLVIGVVALLAEVAFLPVQKYVIEPDYVTDPAWKRGLKALFLILLLFGLLFGAVVMHDKGWF